MAVLLIYILATYRPLGQRLALAMEVVVIALLIVFGYREFGFVCGVLLVRRILNEFNEKGIPKLMQMAGLIREEPVRKDTIDHVKVLPKIGSREWRSAIEPSENAA